MKRCTDINQSKKLAKILRLESADMCYLNDGTAIKVDATSYNATVTLWSEWYTDIIPCWSLGALLDVLPEGIIENHYVPNLQKENGKYSIAYGNEELLCVADNPIDACYEMILKLSELKIL